MHARVQFERLLAGKWVTIFCLLFAASRVTSPLFSPRQAYISSFSLYPEVPESGADRNSELTLILMASSADPAVFKELLRGKKYIAQVR